MCQGSTLAPGLWGGMSVTTAPSNNHQNNQAHAFARSASPAPRTLLSDNPTAPCAGMHSPNAQDAFNHHKHMFCLHKYGVFTAHVECDKYISDPASVPSGKFMEEWFCCAYKNRDLNTTTSLNRRVTTALAACMCLCFFPKHALFFLLNPDSSSLCANLWLREAHLCQHVWHQTLWPLLTHFIPFASSEEC